MRYLIGFLAALGVLSVVLFAATGFAIYWAADRYAEPDDLPESIVLKAALSGSPADVTDSSPIADLVPTRRRLSLFAIVSALEAARTDERVKGLVMDLSGAEIGLAEAQELRAAILGFRAAGKSARVHADSFEGRRASAAYYLATAFESISVQPSGLLDIRGLSITTPLLGKLLREQGVRAEVQTRHEFKGAAVPVTSESLPEPIRANYARAVDSMYEQLVAGIATGRNLSPSAVRTIIDSAPLVAEEARRNRLVDAIAYRDEMHDAGIGGSPGAELVDLAAYAKSRRDEMADMGEDETARIALISADGEIVRGKDRRLGSRGVAASENLVAAIREAREDPLVKALVLRIDSPGGSYVASDSILRALQQTREAGIPIVVSMSNLAASGGYFITLAADHVVAHPATLTGSIGVLGGKISIGELLSRHGVESAEVSAGANASMFSPLRSFSEDERERLSLILDEIYADFTTRVAKRRRLSAAEIDAAARGRIWTGEDALRLGLVDVLGGLDDAFQLARQSAGLEPDQIAIPTVFPKRGSPLERLLESIEDGRLLSLANRIDDLVRVIGYAGEVVETLPETGVADRVMLRMPDMITR
jgi:protease-4